MQKKLFRLSVPIFVEAIMNTIIGSVDTIMLSSYSDDAVAAVSIANQILFLIQVLACIVTTGTSILCAQYIGAKKTEEEQNDLITASILLNVGMGVVLTVLMSVFYPVILRFLNLSGQVRSYAGEYLGVLNWFLWVQLLYFIFSAVLKSYGRTTQCMYVSIGMNVCNIVLNYLLIPRMGAMGASVATLMTQVVVTLIAPLFYKRVRPSVKHMTDAFFARDLRDRLKGVIGKRDENRA